MPTARLAALALLCLLSGCSKLALFDTLVAKDEGSERVACDVAFGDHPRQQLDIYRPTQAGASPAPVLVFIYGGAWKDGDKDLYTFAGRAFAARGFVTVVPDYRLVPEVHFPDYLTDNARAIRWVADRIERYGGDPRRIVLVGHSAGAYNAAMLALRADYLRDVGVDPRVIRGVAGISGPYDFFPFDDQLAIDAMGRAEDPGLNTQPIRWVDPADPPMLLVTGTADPTVKPRNTRALAAALREAGVRVETRFYEDRDHVDPLLALSRWYRDETPVLEDIVSFLESLD